MHQNMSQYRNDIGRLRDYFEYELTKRFANIRINGHPKKRLYHNLNVIFEGIDSESMLLQLNAKGIAASNGSACNAGVIEPSHVLRAIGYSTDMANSAIRFTLGKTTTMEDINYVLNTIQTIFKRNT